MSFSSNLLIQNLHVLQAILFGRISEERMQNIARNQEMVRKLFEGKDSPATKANMKR